MANVKFNRGKTRANSITASKTPEGYSNIYFPTDSATIILGVGSTTDNREYGQAVQDAAGAEKAFLLGHSTQGTIATTISNANVYMQADKLYSNDSEVVNVADAQTITATKTFSGGISMNGTQIRKVKTPTANDDAANKQYVDSTIADIPIKKGDGFQSMVQKIEGTFAFGQHSSAFGLETSASGNSANAEGWRTKSKGVASHAEGVQTEANGNASHTEGQKTITLNKAEHAEGTWNLSIKDKTIHTVGIGSDDNARKNAEEIHFDGKKYVYDIGGYDGTNSQTEGTKTVQEVVAESANAVQIKYTDLKSLRNAGKLVPGTQYRITDYTCTTTQAGTGSAGHVFDIIVTADDESTLNEVARAIKHEGDTYFANSNLSAWKIWYCLDNDITRFTWADEENGKGVIYRMIDEFDNDVPYDFKNIQFYRKWNSSKSLWSTISSNNTGVPCYTFSSEGDSSTTSFTDCSSSASNYVYSNVIKEHTGAQMQFLNNNCFFGNSCNGNTFGTNCYDNSFGAGCYDNSFGADCRKNTFVDKCHNNSFGYLCYGNSFGYQCYGNSFGYRCYDNSFGHGCSCNTFGNSCYSNTFSGNCWFNSFGNSCKYNTFEYDCRSNSFGNSCEYNSFGDNCWSNVLENYCCRNSFGNSCWSNSFGNSCNYNTFGKDCNYNSFGNECGEIKFASDSMGSTKYDFYQNNHFGDGCQYIVFKGIEGSSENPIPTNPSITNSGSPTPEPPVGLNQVRKYNFAQGLQGTSSAYLTIDGVRGRTYETKVAKNSKGELKIYCEVDLIL